MTFIYVPFSYLMKGCLWLVGGSYVFALLFFALAIQIVMIPIYIKQQKSQINSAKVRPMEMAIREKYKGRNDRATQQKMTMEIQEMYQKNGYSQFSGCLPMLIMLPILLILYSIVRNPISYASNLTKNSEFDSVDKQAAVAVDFYQAEKEALIKESYETTEKYNDAVSAIESIQTNLGGKAQKEKDEDGKETEVKTESGITIYKYDSKGSQVELVLSKLIIDGRDELQSEVDDGHLPASIIEAYDATGLAKFSEDLPNFHIFGLNVLNAPDFGSNAWLLIVPLLVFLTQFCSIKLNRKFVPGVPGPNGKPVGSGLFMEVGMPLLSAYFAWLWPAAMGVYWIWRTLLDMLKSFIFYKAMPIPQVTEEQIAAARKELKGSSSGKKKKRITIEVDEDDDSYDDLVVKKGGYGGSNEMRPRRIEMLTADDEPESAPNPADGGDDAENGSENEPKSETDNENN